MLCPSKCIQLLLIIGMPQLLSVVCPWPISYPQSQETHCRRVSQRHMRVSIYSPQRSSSSVISSLKMVMYEFTFN